MKPWLDMEQMTQGYKLQNEGGIHNKQDEETCEGTTISAKDYLRNEISVNNKIQTDDKLNKDHRLPGSIE